MWAKKVGRLEALKQVLEELRKRGAAEALIAAVNYSIREEEKANGKV